jgi:ABC-2 type transport system permease protein
MSGQLTYEWRRARSIRTTWVTGLATIVSVAALAWLVAQSVTPEQPATATELVLTSVIGNPLVIVLVASLGSMAFGHEYRYGTIRVTLTAFPRRTGVFFAKLATTVVLVLLVSALAVAAGYAAVRGSGVPIQEGSDWAGLLWQSAIYTASVALVAFGLTVVTRSHPLGIVGPLLITVLEAVLVAVSQPRFASLGDWLPLSAMSSWLAGVEPARSAAVWAVWLLALLAAGLVLLKRRDA